MDKDQNQFGVFRENRNQLDALMFIKVNLDANTMCNKYFFTAKTQRTTPRRHIEVTARQMLQMELELQSDEDYEEAYMDSSKLP
ncbi:hypothetical protein HNY73_011313 [Argiope bruennichi]|uniref:Uncharacterized protein n=1 Tax=Argiope bruennichi TaxID=94029 RepID=A0A8T0F8R2_ARGBR|nr:hypothetical protein HNY73_011313 [Argiope bruennichi]